MLDTGVDQMVEERMSPDTRRYLARLEAEFVEARRRSAAFGWRPDSK